MESSGEWRRLKPGCSPYPAVYMERRKHDKRTSKFGVAKCISLCLKSWLGC